MAPLNPKATSFHPPPVVPPRPAKRLPPQAQVGEIPMNRSPIPPPPPGSPPPPPPPPPAGPPRLASRQRSSIPQMGQVPEGRVPRPLPSLRPLLPPRFEARRRIELQQRPGFEEALNWYRDHLTEADYNFNNPTGLTDIQKLLRGDANPAPGVDSHSWRPVRDLGAGTYGSVVLWQRDTGNCDHVGLDSLTFGGVSTDGIHSPSNT